METLMAMETLMVMQTLGAMKTLAPVTDLPAVAEPILRSQRCGPAPENPCQARMQPWRVAATMADRA